MKTFILRTAVLIAAPLLLFVLLHFVLLHDVARATDTPTAALTFVVTPVAEHPLHNPIVATGNVVAWREMPISAEASGLAVTEIAVDEGDVVAKGQVLAQLNSRVLEAQVAQQTAAISELEATLANAQSDVRRARSVSQGVISGQTTEQRETLVKTTAAKLAAARAALGEVEARLGQTTVVAPAAGIVATRSVALGQVVPTGTEMFRLIQDSRIEVDAQVPEADIFSVKTGQTARVVDPTGTAQHGTVRLVAPKVDAKTRLGTVHIALPAGTAMRPGMFARVEIATDVKTALAVPLKALVWRESKAGVFKITADNIAELTEIEIGRKTSDLVEIAAGLSRGDRIVVDGAGLINDGDRVRVEVASTAGSAAQ